MRKLLLLLLLLVGCTGTNEQIAACVQNCKQIEAKMLSDTRLSYLSYDGTFKCTCVRQYIINADANNIKEIGLK